MLKRVILFMGTPVFGGVLLFPLFYYLKVRWWAEGVELPQPAAACKQLGVAQGGRGHCQRAWPAPLADLPVKQGLDLPNRVTWQTLNLRTWKRSVAHMPASACWPTCLPPACARACR